MRSSRDILEEYRVGDLEKRLNLFLECPSLRVRFLQIDQMELAENTSFEISREENTAVRES